MLMRVVVMSCSELFYPNPPGPGARDEDIEIEPGKYKCVKRLRTKRKYLREVE